MPLASNGQIAASWARQLFRGPTLRERALAWFTSRRAAYREVFRGAAVDVVLADLARFCHAQSTTHVVGDTHGSAQLEGRRQVWLRIRGYLALEDEQVEEMTRRAVAQQEGVHR